MNEPSDSNKNNLRSRFSRFRGRISGLFPFALGVLAMLLALTLYHYIFPATQMTQRDVNTAIANAMASATPRPAFSTEVYQIIQPSLILIQAELTDGDNGLGSGAGVDNAGDVLALVPVGDGASRILL